MKKFLNWLDPYRQGPLYFKWGFFGLLFVGLACWWGCTHWDGAFIKATLDNMFVYLPNYLTHEMAGHNLVGMIGWRICYSACRGLGEWWIAAMGNGVETLIPLGLLVFSLRLNGGRWLLPILWYWLASTLYGAGIYASDARAMKLPLTSSDMVSNFAPGTVKGDWHYILQPLGLLDYDIIIGRTLIFLGIICLVIAIYSLYYYWTHSEQYLEGNKRW